MATKTKTAAEPEAEDKPSVQRFWMVYGLGQGCPRYHHDTKEGAVSEAKRLAAQSPGVDFVVLGAVDAYRASVNPVERMPLRMPVRTPDDDIPF
jgi:hypothetical protein